MTAVRSFVAVPLPGETQQAILAAALKLGEAAQGISSLGEVKWSRKVENLHITLKFLGPVEEPVLDRLAAALDQRLRSFGRFTLTLAGFGAFPSARKANVIWAGTLDPDENLQAVAAAVEEVAAAVGVPPAEGEQAKRRFHGHITVGRARRPVDARAALEASAHSRFGATRVSEVQVSEIHVYESRLGRDGSTYILRHRALLGGGHKGETHGDDRQDREQGN
jgi:2'-5' RNA ligase